MDKIDYIKKYASSLIDIIRKDGGTKDAISVLALFLFFKHQGKLYEIKENYYNADFGYRWVTDMISRFGHLDFMPILSKEIKNLRTQTIRELVYDINILFSTEDIRELFEEIISQNTSDISDGVGTDYQPYEISKFICLLGNSPKIMRVYNPFAGLASYGVYFGQQHNYTGEELNERIWALGKVRLILNHVKEDGYTRDNSIYHWNSAQNKFDLVVSSPPMNSFSREKMYYFRQQYDVYTLEEFVIKNSLFNALKPDGKFIGFFSESLLFANAHWYTSLRKDLVEYQNIEMIISLPSNIMYSTSVKTSILILNKSRNDCVKFVDGTTFVRKEKRKNIFDYENLFQAIRENDSRFIRTVSIEAIRKNNYLLSVNRYFIEELNVPEGFRTVPLESLLIPYEHPSTLPYDFYTYSEPMGRLISASDLSDNPYQYELYPEKITELKPVAKCKSVVDEVVLISLTGKLKAVYCYASEKNIVFLSQGLLAYEVRTNQVVISYLINQLHSEYVQKQVAAFSVGSVAPRINRQNFENIRILLPASLEEQEAIAKSAKEAYQLASAKELGLEELVKSMQAEYMDDMRIKKHNLAQYVNGLQSSVAALTKYIDSKGGTISLGDFISEHRNISVAAHLESMSEITNQIGEFVNGLTNELDFEPAVKIDLRSFITKYIRNYNTNELFKINYVFDEDSFMDSRKIVPYTHISRQALTEVFNNIVGNARRHGFVEGRKDYEINILLSYDFEEKMIEIKFQNNGKSMPRGMNTERFGLKNEKAGATANEGIGGFRIKQIMQHYHGSFSIYTDEDDEFPVTIQLYLPLIKN